ncbi:restriction endonuclease subunit S [Selenomonas ruminantium]|uniref:restriction endonuclease subunit S n=1 Tax=Selenomonas ruminantium TaxID=971 RepID=UPI000413459B|nr:restriction endonuclease subunit S [Selenomonas ruminantium]
MSKLGDIARFQSGGTPSRKKAEYFRGEIPWISTVALNGDIIGFEDAKEFISELAITESAAKIVPANSIMVGTRVGVGKVAINNVPMSTSQDVVSLVDIDEAIWNKKYIVYSILAKTEYLNNQARGATIKGIKIDVLENIEIIDRCIDEQIKIVSIMDQLNKMIDNRNSVIDVLDVLVKSRFVEMFGDFNIELPFQIWKLDCIADIVSGITKGRKTKEKDLREVPYMAVSNVKDGYIDWTTIKTIMATEKEIEQYRIQPNDILMTEGGDPDKVGRGALINEVPEDCIHQNHIFRVRLNEKVNPTYFEAYLQQPFTKRYFLKSAKQTTGIASINMTQLRNTPVIVPPIELQNQFADFVVLTDKSKLAVQQSIETLQMLKAKLMQDYFG